ncbi:MAG TPA: PQQ-binding-like beta-propeller repeat protein, partial [Ktedonobacterales bacterium]
MSHAVDFLTQLTSARRQSPARRIALTALLTLLLSVGTVTFAPPAFAAANEDWPTFLHDPQRTAASGETILSTANAATLKLRWTYLTGGPLAASPTLAGGIVYVGSWDGYEYAIDAKAGTIKWKTFLGQTTTPNCNPTLIGITSAATVLNNVVYVGGGDSNWYALDAGTGTVLWSVPTGDNSIAGGHYNWSSPLIANGSAYIGIASNCDNPLVQGELLRVDLTSHAVVATAKFVPDGQVGGGVWTSPALDTATNTVYVTTGTQNLPSQTMPQGLVSLNATTLAINGSWQIPPADALNDADFGNSPILFTTAAGRALVAATNKNGYVYAFDRANVSAGPVWRTRIAIGGECPTCGDGSVSSMAFAKGVLYAAGGNTIIGGAGYQGSVRALDPATGNIIWEHGDTQPVVPALAYDNGLVIDGAGNILEVLDASTGKRLYTYQAGGGIYSAPSVWNGKIYFGALDSKVYSLTLPGTITLPPPDPQCPTSWTCEDIGNPAAGTESYAGGTWTVTAAGAQGLHGTGDQFRLISQPASGDMQVSAQIVSQQSDGAP